MKELIKKPELLPDNIDKLQEFVLIGKQKLIACKAHLKAIDDVNLGINVYDQKLHETQDLAGVVLMAEAKMGELLKAIPDKKATSGEGSRSLPSGITHKQSHYAQELSKNIDVIDDVIEKAVENKEVPRRSDVIREIHKKEKLKDQDEIILPEGEYKTIIIDPAWPIDKIHRDTIPQGINLDYKKGRMTTDAIKAMDLPAADDCHLFLWTTQKYLPISFEILKEWEFKYIFTMAWHKAGGFQPFNLPQYNCEFAVYGRKGSPKFLETKNFFTCFNGKRREHSRKPVEFYDLIRRVCPEPRIDIFGREKIKDFDSFGDEVDKF